MIHYDCNTCKVLQEQLDYERDRNKEMMETLMSLLKPQVIIQSETEFKPMTPTYTRWSRRKAELERLDRETAQVKMNSPVIARPDTGNDIELALSNNKIDALEEELGVK